MELQPGHPTENDNINHALAKHLASPWSPESEQKIVDEYGREIADKAKAVYDAVIDCPVDWSKASMDSALDLMHEFINQNYSWLSKEARCQLNYNFIIVWK
jgi:hypothetical protein